MPSSYFDLKSSVPLSLWPGRMIRAPPAITVGWPGEWPRSAGEQGERGAMLRTRAPEASLWEAVLPEEVLRLSEELARVDALLDDSAFFVPFVPFFDPRVGRPSIPMEVTCG
jgi:hypothetical protein